MNRSILVVICDFIITSMIYLNGGFSALESQPYDGRPADQATVSIIVTELESQRVELEKVRSELIKKQASAEELEKVTAELAAARTRLEYLQRNSELNANNAGVITPVEDRKELAGEIMQKNLAQARFELVQEQLKTAQENQQRNLDFARESAAALKTKNEELLRSRQDLARLNERIAGQQSRHQQELKQKEEELKRQNELLKKKEAELAARARQLNEVGGKLDQASKQLASTATTLTGVRKDLERTQGELQNTQAALKKTEADRNSRLQAANQRFNAAQAQHQKNIDALRQELEAEKRKRDIAEKSSATYYAALAREQALKQASEQELAKTKDDLRQSRESLKTAEQQNRDALQNIATMKGMISDTSRQLSKAQSDSAALKAEMKKVQQENVTLKTVSAKLEKAEADLAYYKSDVAQTRHSETLLQLHMTMLIKRVLHDRSVKVQNYLPAVQIGNQQYVITSLNKFCGHEDGNAPLGEIIKLEYTAGRPQGAAERIKSPVLVLKDDNRVAMMNVAAAAVTKPLTMITWDELRKRGSLDFYLCKSSGVASVKLENRCHWGAGSDKYIYVSNKVPRSANVLKAEVGDLLLTRQGELAAVVIAADSQTAQCYVFKAAPAATEFHAVSQGEKTHKAFGFEMNKFLQSSAAKDK